MDFSEIRNWPSVDFRYLAPECYDNRYYPESDIFSFGLILYELVTGEPAFKKDLDREFIAAQVAVHDYRPEIPNSVLPGTRKLIEDCWEVEPEDRLSFEEIVEQLMKMNYKVVTKVSSWKLGRFVKKIEKSEAISAAIQK
jgi:serine/threonine protein kinase